MNNYVVTSLELHLFFSRIMKEHSLFLEAGFLDKNMNYKQKADDFRRQFENLLEEVTRLSNRTVRKDVLVSGEVFTEFTLLAERKTQEFTGIPINTGITRMQQNLTNGRGCRTDSALDRRVSAINRTAIQLLNGLITLKENTLDNVLSCRMFTANYPLLLKHIIREAKLYRAYTMEVEKCGFINMENRKEVESFWNQIMMEHALFIRGLLDPTEAELIDTADGFAKDYAALLEAACRKDMACRATQNAIAETVKYREFKKAGASGILECKIQSIILPLLADHVLREANHYLRILNEGSCN